MSWLSGPKGQWVQTELQGRKRVTGKLKVIDWAVRVGLGPVRGGTGDGGV